MLASTPRIAIYGRHSTDKQNPNSSADQAAACESLVRFHNGQVVGTYLDAEISGYHRDRPGLKRLLRDIAAGHIDIVLAESLDRLARDPEDVSWLGKMLNFSRVRLWTISENEIDDVKFAVASMLGALFLSQLRQKVHRGLSAAVLAGRFAGGRAYGYRKINGFDERGRPLTGLLEIDSKQAEQVRQIFTWFAAGLSSVQIAKQLNLKGVAGPRGRAWNASTIRGDPKKLVGILNNPLYRGELIWNRREWRKNPDSERRERLYRLRDESEWIRCDVPDLRIVDDELWNAVRVELSKRQQAPNTQQPARHRRRKHLLSGLIKCATCGSNYTISGRDYYRCAGVKERATCDNRVSVRLKQIEHATLASLKHRLLTEDHVRAFAKAFQDEIARLSRESLGDHGQLVQRLAEVEAELANLEQNMLSGVLSPTLMRLLTEREAEKSHLQTQLSATPVKKPALETLSHAGLLTRFTEKVNDLCNALNDERIRAEAAQAIGQLIERVTIHPTGPKGPEVEVIARVEKLVGYAANENSPLKGLDEDCSVMVVAGDRFGTLRRLRVGASNVALASFPAGSLWDFCRRPNLRATISTIIERCDSLRNRKSHVTINNRRQLKGGEL